MTTYSPNTREKMMLFMLDNKGQCTSADQTVTTSMNYFYEIMKNMSKRHPNSFVKKSRPFGSISNRILYKLTWAGFDYARKVKSIREVEGR